MQSHSTISTTHSIQVKPSTSRVTERMELQRVQTQLSKLFDVLVAQGHQTLKADRSNLHKVPTGAQSVLSPLMNELRDFDESLDREEFIDSCQNLLSSVSGADKRTLLGFDKKVAQDRPGYNFQPKINAQSKTILRNDQLRHMAVEDRLLVRGQIKDAKLNRLKKAAQKKKESQEPEVYFSNVDL